MPPPNANGALHMGHAIFVTLEDLMIRYHRMKQEPTLWLPGADHAGFETQVVFDKKLEKEGKNRFQIPRPELFKMIWDFTQENRETMVEQLKKLGASCDWTRDKFTLDPDIIQIVYNTFQKLYEDGLAYRDFRPVNWCTKHQTALSDLEVKYVERKDPLYYIKYGPLTLATVRPETKFGDTAVAVHPNDKRYQKYVGQEIEIETLLGRVKIKVIADEAVDPQFGTGVVKITPSHDPNDFEIAKRHNLERREVIDAFGKMNEKAGPYQGLKIMEARQKVVEDMKAKGLLIKVDENYTHTVGTCYKCGTTLEPRVLPQWFIRMNEPGRKTGKVLSQMGIEAAESGKIKFVTPKFKKIYLHWLKNLRDWNVSRQIVWGIQIPAWYCGGLEKAVFYRMGFAESVVPQVFAGKTKTYRLRDHFLKVGDRVAFENSQTKRLFGYGVITDVEHTTVGKIRLDDPAHGATYQTRQQLIAAFKRHHPEKKIDANTKVIIYTYKFSPIANEDGQRGCGEIIISQEKPSRCPTCGASNLTQDPDVFDTWFSSGQWPFATLRASPYKGDFDYFYPTSVMETAYDILFFWVARMIMLGLYVTDEIPYPTVYLHGLMRAKDRQKMSKSKGNVIDPLGVAEIYGTDAVRFALIYGNTIGQDSIISEEDIRGMRNFCNKIWNAARFVLTNREVKSQKLKVKTAIQKSKLHKDDQWVLKELGKTIRAVTDDLDKFRFEQAAHNLYDFFWHTFCDKYIEMAKKRRKEAQPTLLYVLEAFLKLLHPFMPFITEEIYQRVPKHGKSIMIAPWPKS